MNRTMIKPWMKWGLPLTALAVAAALVGAALAMTGGGGAGVLGDEDWGFADANPAYSELAGVMPAEEAEALLYSIAISEPVVAVQGSPGEIFEVTLTAGDALLEELKGNITVTAVAYGANNTEDLTKQWVVVDLDPTEEGVQGVDIITFDNVTLHPEGEIVLPVFTSTAAIEGAIADLGDYVPNIALLLLKAEFLH